MFEFIRKHSKLVMALLFLLIIPSFIIVGGLDRYSMFNEQNEKVATVDGHGITRMEWDAAHQREVDRVRATNPGVDAALLDTPGTRFYTLEGLVRDRVLSAAAQKSMLLTSDARLARVLLQDPNLRKPDGTVDMDRYRELVGAMNMTPAAYETKLRGDIAQRQVLFGVAGTAFAPEALTAVTEQAFFGRREIQIARFSAADFVSKAQPSEADLEAFYKAHEADYRTPERSDIEYVVLDAEAVKRSISINEQDLRSYYDQNVAAQAAKEQRRVSHIMVEAPKSASQADRDKAKAKAQELLARVRKSPDSFADVARKESSDAGSAANGGDLDYAARGGFVSKVLENTAFELKQKGDISDVVESEFGYHVVRLTDIRKPEIKSFEQSRAQLETEYREKQAQSKFSEIAEQFTNTVYEQSDSLKPAAEKFKLEIRTARGITRSAAPDATGALASRKFLNALFSADATEKKRNTEAIEVGPNQLASGRVVNHQAARTPPLADVKDKVRAAWIADKAAELARKEGEAKLAQWKAAPAQAQVGAALQVSRDQPGNQPSAVVEAALRADAGSLPALVGADLGGEGYAVIRVNKALASALPADAKAQAAAQVAQAIAAAENLAYYNLLKDRFKVTYKTAKPAASE
jgi:peptidyl-prolyl cis-trans isomerase D